MERQAESLAEFLTTPAPGNYSFGKSPLVLYVETAIKAMAADIAAEVIAENTELAAVIRRKARAVVAQALLEDTYLNQTITNALATALVKVALDGQEDDDE
jgi:hypothetical protein